MAIFRVNTALDLVDPNDDLLSLREAITAANQNQGRDRIVVSLFLDDPIESGADMPSLTGPLIFNGRGATLDTSNGTPFLTGANGLAVDVKNVTLTAQVSGSPLFATTHDGGDFEIEDVTVDTGGGGGFISTAIRLEGEDNSLRVSDVDGTQASGQFVEVDGLGNEVEMDDVDLTLGDVSGARALLADNAVERVEIDNSTFRAAHPDSVSVEFDVFQPFDLRVEDSRFLDFAALAVFVEADGQAGSVTLTRNTFRGEGGDSEAVRIQDAQDIDFRSSFNRYVDHDWAITIAGDVTLEDARSTFDVFRGNNVAILNDAMDGSLAVRFPIFIGNDNNIGGSGDTDAGLFGL